MKRREQREMHDCFKGVPFILNKFSLLLCPLWLGFFYMVKF